MSEGKIEIIKNSADEYKKLPNGNKMFVLGYMQGVLSVLQGKECNQSYESIGVAVQTCDLDENQKVSQCSNGHSSM